MMLTIDPERLRQIRQLRRLSQAALAKAAHVDKQTIYRLEHERKPRRLEILKRVTKALDIEVADLTGEKPMPAIAQQPNTTSAEPAYPFPVRVHPAIRNAFELAARRYRVSVPTIARLAPLLFVILAEASLRHRSGKADECRAKIDALEEAASELPYSGISVWDENLRWEEDAIRDKDVFGGQLPNAGGDGWDSDNPFATYLEALAAKYAAGDVTIDAIGPTSANYRVCRLAALALAGGEQELADSFLSGGGLIHQMLRGLSQEERIARMRDLQVSGREIEEEIPDDVPEELPEYHNSNLVVDFDL